MNCSESPRLRTLLNRLLLELQHRGNASGLGAVLGPNGDMEVMPDTSPKGDDAYLYILLIMMFYVCLAGGLILAYTHSCKLIQAKDQMSQACPQHQRATGGALAAANSETDSSSPAEELHHLAPGELPVLAQGTQGV